jgi:photosystem II stability/assembly factor-like uncharacterized protein
MPTVKRSKPRASAPKPRGVVVLVATRKGAWLYHGDPARKKWRVNGPHFLGHLVHHVVLDPRDGRTLLAAAKTGHLGPTVFRSTDFGRTWKEASKPPAFVKPAEGSSVPARSVDHTFWLTPAHGQEPNVWYAGTSPQGLFRSEDGGVTWAPFSPINEDAKYRVWMGAQQDGTPDGPKMHSIIVDPRDPNHLYASFSPPGTFESTDGGADWKPLNGGVEALFQPVKEPEFGQDPHCVRMHPLMPDRLYQQNHCGIYRIDRPSTRWERIGKNMPKEIGDIGFPMVLHPRDPDTVWVFPMDGTEVWPRVSPGGKPAAYVTRNAGKSWKRQDKGLPRSQGWFTVRRQAFTADAGDPVGLYFGTTGGELWMSRDEGARWETIAAHLPLISSVETQMR